MRSNRFVGSEFAPVAVIMALFVLIRSILVVRTASIPKHISALLLRHRLLTEQNAAGET